MMWQKNHARYTVKNNRQNPSRIYIKTLSARRTNELKGHAYSSAVLICYAGEFISAIQRFAP